MSGININQNLTTQAKNQYLDYLIDPRFQVVNFILKRFILKLIRLEQDTQFFHPTEEIKKLQCYDRWWKRF